jgi:hypothetical protein
MNEDGGVTIVEYIGYNNPRKLNSVLMQNGFPSSTSYGELIDNATTMVGEDPSTTSDILAIHPDREEIINDYLSKNPKPKKLGIQKETSSNCSGGCGCGGNKPSSGKFVDGNFVPQQTSNAIGDGTTSTSTYVLLGLGAVAVLALFHVIK